MRGQEERQDAGLGDFVFSDEVGGLRLGKSVCVGGRGMRRVGGGTKTDRIFHIHILPLLLHLL